MDQDSQVTRANPRSTEGAEAAAFVVRVIEGLDRGRTLRLDGSEPFPVLVGKGPTSTLQLNDAAVSRRHLSLTLEGARVRVTDLGSTNGTRLDGTEIVEAFAVGGETLRLGSTSIRLERAGAPAAAAASSRTHFQRVLGASPEMRKLYPICERLAASDVPVIIEGETGTGKEAMAEALHEASARAARPFVVFDCTTVPANLVESELFGHERGAFTGASAQRKGLFEAAEGGTLLIDEIGDLDVSLQPKLLRAVERSEIRRVGGSKPVRCNVRLLAATRRDLEREVQAERFRDDLFHRLAVGRIELPPLRRRKADIGPLARHFWTEMGGDPAQLTSSLLESWERAPWPGNVRELRNAVARRIALGEYDPTRVAAADDTAEEVDATEISDILGLKLPYSRARRLVLRAFERRYVRRVLAANGGNIAAAAAESGIARRYFQLIKDRITK